MLSIWSGPKFSRVGVGSESYVFLSVYLLQSIVKDILKGINNFLTGKFLKFSLYKPM